MKKTLISALLFLLLGYVLSYAEIPGRVTVSGTQFQVCGNRIWLSGCNTPWDNWNDFGGSYDSAFWGQHFADLHAAGVNASRIWITCSGEVGINISTTGVVTGGTAAHWNNLDDLFAKAQANGIYIMATLISFDHFKQPNTTYQNWRNWIASDSNIDTYINTYLDTFLTRYASNPALWAIDLCNEPEWASSTENTGEPAVYGAIDWARLQTYFAKAAVKIHKYNQANGTGVLVTTGMGYIKYNSDTRGLGGGNKVSDSALAALITVTADKPLAKMDFWSPHYYPWQDQWGWTPFLYTPSAFGLPNDRPAVVGECPNKYGSSRESTVITPNVSGYLKTDYTNAYNNGWQGVFPWTSNNAGSGDFGDLDNELRPAAQQMQTMIPTLVAPPACNPPTSTWTPGGPTATFTNTGTNTHTATITPTPLPYTIIYDGDTAGAARSNGTIYNDSTSTMTQQTGGVTGNAMRIVYTTDTDFWQEARWDMNNNPAIGSNAYLTFEIKVSSGTMSSLLLRANWGTVYPNIVPYLTSGSAIDTTWRTARVPLADILEAGQTVLDFIVFINNSNDGATVFVDNIRLESTVSATFTPTNTSTSTQPTINATNTLTRTITNTNTHTFTYTSTYTPTHTLTYTFTSTITDTIIPNTSTFTVTNTPSKTFTNTPTNGITGIPTSTHTFTYTPTNAISVLATSTLTNTYTPTNAISVLATSTLTNTYTPTNAISVLATSTLTNTYTPTNAISVLATSTLTHTYTPTNEVSILPTSTFSYTNTPGDTPTKGIATSTFTYTFTPSKTFTYTPTDVITEIPTSTFTYTNTPGDTPTKGMATSTFTYTFTPSKTFTYTPTGGITGIATFTHTDTYTGTPTEEVTWIATFTHTDTYTGTPTGAATGIATSTFTYTFTPSKTHTDTPVYTNTFTNTFTSTFTRTSTFTATNTPTKTFTVITSTHTYTSTQTPAGTLSATATSTNAAATTVTFTFTATHTQTPTATPLPADNGGRNIQEILAYPNPYNPLEGDLRIQYTVKKGVTELYLRIYSSSFRFLKEEKLGRNLIPGDYVAEIIMEKLKKLANGTYYYLIIDNEGAGSEIQKVIILK